MALLEARSLCPTPESETSFTELISALEEDGRLAHVEYQPARPARFANCIAPISDGEKAAMALAEQVARDSSQVEQAHIERLREAGFSDTDIFDVVAAAAWRCFFAKIPDALGALPDRALGQLEPGLLSLLLVGRPLEQAPDMQYGAATVAQGREARAEGAH